MGEETSEDPIGELREFLDALHLDPAAEQHIIYLAESYVQNHNTSAKIDWGAQTVLWNTSASLKTKLQEFAIRYHTSQSYIESGILTADIIAAIEQNLNRMAESAQREKQRATFRLLWDMVNQIEDDEGYEGTIISRYASMIDDRINNSGYSRSVDSLKLYSIEQLQAEIESRKDDHDHTT